MSTRMISLDPSIQSKRSTRARILDRLARRLVLSRLKHLAHGQIVVSENGEQTTYGHVTESFPLTAQIRVLDPAFYSDIAFGGSTGAGEGYIRGYWACNELSDLMRIFMRNRTLLNKTDGGIALLGAPLRKLLHALNKNTRQGSQKNISAHYDLGNDFYELWLDPTMMYSSAFFESAECSLEEGSIAKLDKICRQLRLTPEDSVIEIGTGWGGFAIHAAKNYGCHVTTTTISKQQHAFAEKAIRAAGLEDKITLLLEDYRDLEGKFDKLVSIEMIEAVGHEFHDTYFKKCCDLLKPDGEMLLQAITIEDQRYARYKRNVDFIRRYIFPGGCLTSVTDMCRTLTAKTDMRAVNIEDFGPHYAATLRHWHDRFFARIDEVREMAYSDEFIRMWQFYLCSCEGAFTERATGVVQMHIVRPEARPLL